MPLSRSELQAVNELANSMAEFLPGPAPGRGETSLSFEGIAAAWGLNEYWSNNAAKKQALATLFENTLANFRFKLAGLVDDIVKRGVEFRAGSPRPLTQEEIKQVSRSLSRLGMALPSASNQSFMAALPSLNKPDNSQSISSSLGNIQTTSSGFRRMDIATTLKDDLMTLSRFSGESRVKAFETFLVRLFGTSTIKVRHPLTTMMEITTGVIEMDGNNYFVIAKGSTPVTMDNMFIAAEKSMEKVEWCRVVVFGYSGFTPDALIPVENCTNVFCVDGQDLFLTLNDSIPIERVMRLKAACAESQGRLFVSVPELMVAQ